MLTEKGKHESDSIPIGRGDFAILDHLQVVLQVDQVSVANRYLVFDGFVGHVISFVLVIVVGLGSQRETC